MHDPSQPEQDDNDVDVAFAAYLQACDSGTLPSREDFLAQFPSLSEELGKLMEAIDLVETATNGNDLPETQLLPAIPSDAETIGTATGGSFYEGAGAGSQLGQSQPDTGMPQTLPVAKRQAGDNGPTLPYTLGDYQLVSMLGRGGMGVVYRAIQQPLQREVAVKMIRSGMLASGAEVKRFFAEARAAAKLHHPGIVSVFHFGHRDGHHFFSMECIRGTDLARRIDHSPLPPEEAARYVRDVAEAIDYAHRHGVLHRDLKPANVLIDEQDQIHITDFGLAKQIDSDSSLTGSGVAVGTPSYMAPEQASGHSDRAGPTTDVYSLGAILFAALTGEPPFSGSTVLKTMMQVIHSDPPRPSNLVPDIPADVETICLKCLEKDPGKRYRSAAALAEDLARFLAGRPILARPRPAVVRAINWMESVPLVAAVTGRRQLSEASQGHRRFQAGILLLAMLIPLLIAGFVTVRHSVAQKMPREIHLGGGLEGGAYSEVSELLAKRIHKRGSLPVTVSKSGGSHDNSKSVLDGTVHLAPMQATSITGADLSVAAPLFYEAAHVLVRRDSNIHSIEDLAGHAVAVGPDSSGSRQVAEYLLDSYALAPQSVPRKVIPWPQLNSTENLDAAVICIGRRSKLIGDLLDQGWGLLPVQQAIEVSLQHPTLRTMTIPPTDFPSANLPPGGIPTVGTTAFLAVRTDLPDKLVTLTLESLYESPPLFPGMIPRLNAAEWQGLVFHPAARRYYAQSQAEDEPVAE